MEVERMKNPDRLGDLEEIFEILVTSYSQKGGAVPTEGNLCWRPATDAYETDGDFIVQMDLAGMDPTRIEVLTDGESLTVRGVRPETAGAGKKHFHKMEINVGPFVRRIPIIVDVDLQHVTAEYRSGFLYVTFRKGTTEDHVRRKIDVER